MKRHIRLAGVIMALLCISAGAGGCGDAASDTAAEQLNATNTPEQIRASPTIITMPAPTATPTEAPDEPITITLPTPRPSSTDTSGEMEVQNYTTYTGDEMPNLTIQEDRSTVASDPFVAVFVYPDGSISARYWPVVEYDFSDWVNIVNVSALYHTVVGVKSDGTVLVTGDMIPDVTYWHDIKMAELTRFGILGLKHDGELIFEPYPGEDLSSSYFEIIEDALEWEDIVYIHSSGMKIVGVDKKGHVQIAVSESYSGFKDEVSGWYDVRTACVSTESVAGLTNSGEVLWSGLNAYTRPSKTTIIDELYGAIKIAIGQWYVAGLMADGTVKVVKTGQSHYVQEETSLDGETDVVEIDGTDQYLFIHKKDSTYMRGGA